MSLPQRLEGRAQERRGLSKLQRTILQLAIANGKKDPGWGCVVTRLEVLEEHYGWRRVLTGKRRTSPAFSPQIIGRSQYSAGQVSLSKAVKRLMARGLLDRWPNRTVLTEAGIRVAEALLESVANSQGGNG